MEFGKVRVDRERVGAETAIFITQPTKADELVSGENLTIVDLY